MCAARSVVKKAAPKKRVPPKKVTPAKKAASAKRACENAIADREAVLAERERALQVREETLLKLEKESDERIAAARARLVEELSEKRIAAEKEISDRREQELDKIEREVANVRSDIRARKQDLDVQENDLKTRERSLERRAQRIEESAQARSAELDEEVGNRIQDVRRSLESQLDTCRKENARLLESLNAQAEQTATYNALTKLLGGKEPAEIRKLLDEQTQTIAQLRKEIATLPGKDVKERLREVETEKDDLERRVKRLEKDSQAHAQEVREVGELRRRNAELEVENKSLAKRAKILEVASDQAQAELERLRAIYDRPQEIEARRSEIEKPLIDFDRAVLPMKPVKGKDPAELAWLDGIGKACDDYGLHFNSRILKSFHTALKTADWSPLTVLAGVSGTGKSELPRLYSHFGGLNFEEVAVQPNWDCQESMLGFFNSIDNKFDAQPLLRFLAQTQKKWEPQGKADTAYPGFYTSMNMVLLDEMNLAHPELYFAEFLSKLETRRGKQGTDVPVLDVKIGAGLPPYRLPLGRNVMWVGTMNQDETTKSLSDKVLDRSIVIYFPRPTKLERRLELKPRDVSNRGAQLHRTVWESWVTRKSNFDDKDIRPYKEFVEGINACLGYVGRALGHRVWQSIEYYMANYPDVRAAQMAGNAKGFHSAMDTAFEDQLVQKVMPKLRGIDTQGTGTGPKCLQEIRAQLDGSAWKDLLPDFDLALTLGYGQFNWQSAMYLEKSEA